MKQITNKHNLPSQLVRLLGKREYSRGQSRWSVTQLIAPPQLVLLREEHGHEIEEDISDRFWSLMGSNIHRILEDGSDPDDLDTIVEQRIFTEVDGITISGAIDVQHSKGGAIGVLDWKFTSVWSVMNPKVEWEQQLNCYAWLVRTTGNSQVDALHVCAILRDWRKSMVEKQKDYPISPMIMVPLKLWSDAEQDAFVRARVATLKSNWAETQLGGSARPCTPEERWERNGVSVRCKDWCEVSGWCPQWAAMKKAPAEAGAKVSEEDHTAGPQRTRKKRVTKTETKINE
jgi:hypothetical protein